MAARMVVVVKRIHSSAPKTVAAWAALHTFPLQKRRFEMNTARAMNPANQKSMVTASAARMPYLCAAWAK